MTFWPGVWKGWVSIPSLGLRKKMTHVKRTHVFMIETSSSAVVFWLFAADFPWQSSAQCYFTKNLDILAFSELYKAPVCSRRFGSRSVVPPTCRLKKFSNNGADSNPSTSLASHSCNSMVEPWWYNRVTPPNPKCHCEKDATYIYICTNKKKP